MTVIPAKAGIQCVRFRGLFGKHWIPAFAGMTKMARGVLQLLDQAHGFHAAGRAWPGRFVGRAG
ncbi:hypothetical protein EZ313_21175 [Ramlibacter henchirensis]|uniref:Uncharacterized protein n=1 Tax=Ramlibacter henchirensis TaxID=204072 RepID=A0A4Z0BNQ8_9BURK|nr:hypothetical protein EZ313_21175 [Ramlibacter henchirensis]